jgi:5-methyltetrahydrofolate--homocysteine methyltransferase
MSATLIEAIADMREEDALREVNTYLAGGGDPVAVLDDCRAAMTEVGRRFEAGQYFVPELILAGEMLKQISDVVKPRLTAAQNGNKAGRVILGTVQGDIHDIGKDIVNFMLDVNGFEVIDLGVDVAPEAFVEKIKEVKPDVVALSGFLTLSYDSMKRTVAAIDAAGLRSAAKIMIGGGTVDEQIRAYAGADAYGKDAMAAVALTQQWTGAN